MSASTRLKGKVSYKEEKSFFNSLKPKAIVEDEEFKITKSFEINHELEHV